MTPFRSEIRMPRSLHRSRQTSARISLALLAASLSFTSGCLEEDEVTPALREASARLESLGAPGSAIPGDEFRISEYRAAIGILRPIASEGSDVQNAAAALMIARAELGLAELPAAELAQLNQKLYELSADVRGELDVWSKLNSLADTAASFNPDAELAQINAKIQERDAEIQAERESTAKVERRVAELEQLSEQAAQAGGELRIQETELRDRANAMNPVEAQPLHEQAAKVRREADALDMKAEQFMAQADTVRPEITDHQLEIGRLTQQRDQLVASTQELAAKAVEGREEAKQLREQAKAVADRLARVVTQMESLRTTEGAGKLDAAKAAYQAALSSVGRARSGDRAGAALASAEIQQTLGNTLSTHAAAAAFAAEVLSQAANSRTPLPVVNSVQSSAASFDSHAKSVRQEAVEALIAARESFSGAGLRAEEAERIDRLTAQINTMIESLGGPSADPEPAFEDEPAQEDSFDEEPATDDDAAPMDDEDPESGEG